jgi:hypothetical protein
MFSEKSAIPARSSTSPGTTRPTATAPFGLLQQLFDGIQGCCHDRVRAVAAWGGPAVEVQDTTLVVQDRALHRGAPDIEGDHRTVVR